MYTSIDIELQALGEKLMENKLGSIVAIDPKTGGILGYGEQPYLQTKTINRCRKKKTLCRIIIESGTPLFNRSVSATYSPGSTFKTLQALLGLHEGVINTRFYEFPALVLFMVAVVANLCDALIVELLICEMRSRMSDNTYFATVMQRVINNPKYPKPGQQPGSMGQVYVCIWPGA